MHTQLGIGSLEEALASTFKILEECHVGYSTVGEKSKDFFTPEILTLKQVLRGQRK